MAELTSLQAACLGLEAALDTALTSAGLDPLTGLHADPAPTTAVAPYGVVSLAGWHGRSQPAPESRVTRLKVTLTLATTGGQTVALAYEEQAAAVLASAKATVAAGVVGASLTQWRLGWGQSQADPDRGATAWRTDLVVDCQLEQ